MLIDLDGDGRVDQLRTRRVGGACKARWFRNNGRWLEDTTIDIELPMLPWMNNEAVPGDNSEFCALNLQRTRFANVHPNGHVPDLEDGSYFYYRFLDMDGDQLPELVAAVEHSPYMWPNLEETSSYPAVDRTPLFDVRLPSACADPNNPQLPISDETAPFSLFMPLIAKSGDSATQDNISTQHNVAQFQSMPTIQSARQGTAQCARVGEPTQETGHVSVECQNGESGYVCLASDGSCSAMRGISNLAYAEGLDRLATPVKVADDPGPAHHPSWVNPHERCGGFLWFVYKNLGNGEFATLPMTKIQPLPLESSAGNSNMGNLQRHIMSHNGFLDLTGDGQLDAFGKLQELSNWQPGLPVSPSLPPGETTSPEVWSLYPGAQDAGFRRRLDAMSYHWAAPYNSLPRQTLQLNDTANNGDVYFYDWNDASLTDVNGDGLQDFVWRRPWDNALYAYYNYGQGFFNSWSGDPDTGAVDVSLDGVPFDAEQMGLDGAFTRATTVDTLCTTPRSNDCKVTVVQGTRVNTLRTLDLDRDGRPDNLTLKSATNQNDGQSEEALVPAVKYGIGDQLLPPVELVSGGAPNATEERLVHALREEIDARNDFTGNRPAPFTGVWQLLSSFQDIDGDGRMDLIEINPDQQGNPSSIKTLKEPVGRPMRLLHTIHNGRGGQIGINYASSHEPIDADRIMDDDIATGKRLPSPRWLVEQVTVDPGYGGATIVTTYRYADPIYSRDLKGQWGFRGFEEIQMFGASGVRTEYRYDYSLDYRGLLATTKIYPQGSSLPSSKKENGYAAFSLFDDTVVTNHVVQSRDYLCRSGDLIAPAPTGEATACDSVMVVSTEWQPQGKNWPGASSVETKPYLYVPVTQRLANHPEEETKSGDRLTARAYHLNTLGDHVYRLKTNQVERFEFAGPEEMLPIGKTQYTYDADLKTAQQTHVWAGSAQSDRRTTTYTYSAVGMELTRRKPAQVAAGNANAVTRTQYDAFALYPARVTNELGHVVETIYDIGLGKMTAIQGPNQRCGSATCAKELRESVYDGFGRLLHQHISVDDPTQGYRLVQVMAKLYVDEGNVSHSPHIITEERRDFDGQTWDNTPKVIRETHLDGLGRVMREVTRRATSGANSETTYTYDAAGNLASVAVPDPRVDATGQVLYTFDYDSLGRLTETYTPDCTGTNCTGMSTRYDGRLTETRERIFDVNEGGRAAVKRRWTDAFGRLIQVDEQLDDGSFATTTYLYDGNDNVGRITDADGMVTEMTHNFVSERIRISRGDRTWRYGYDANGNLTSILYPHESGADAADYTTTMGYDDLDRILLKIVGKRDLNKTEQIELMGDSFRTSYQYDEGDNGIGRLTFVDNGLIGQTLFYDAQGQVVREKMAFDLSPAEIDLVAERSRYADFNAQGNMIWLRTADPAETELTFAYDERGLVQGASYGGQELVYQKRNMAGLVTDRVTSDGRHHIQWTYDVLGHIADLHVQIDGQTQAQQSYSYYDSGDASRLVEQIADMKHTVDYGYDSRHQLQSAQDDQGYSAAFEYSAGGRLHSATVSASPNAPRAYPRNVTYDYSQNSDPELLDQLLNKDGSLYAGYIYDPSGNVTQRNLESGESWSFRYDGHEQQRKVMTPDGKSELYYYIEPGQRALVVTKDASGAVEEVRFYLGETELHYDSQGNIAKSWVHVNMGTNVARIEDGTEVMYQYHSPQGHLLLSADAANNVQGGFTFGPFGEVLAQIGTDAEHPRQFNGKEYDATSGLSYYGYRYYDPMSLQWTQSDPLYRFVPDVGLTDPRRMNLYVFSLNNPLRYIDPDGRDTFRLRLISIGSEGSVEQSVMDQIQNKVREKFQKLAPKGVDIEVTHEVLQVSAAKKLPAPGSSELRVYLFNYRQARDTKLVNGLMSRDLGASVGDKSHDSLTNGTLGVGATYKDRGSAAVNTQEFAEFGSTVRGKTDEQKANVGANVVAHEGGHGLGLDHKAGTVMAESLDASGEEEVDFGEEHEKELRKILQKRAK
ncbi:hypothetical protein KFU94_69460 [Chloroflexi bacterium TSY]|nr:hypothetical protein [Chloroflexi bacterium TSY]